MIRSSPGIAALGVLGCCLVGGSEARVAVERPCRSLAERLTRASYSGYILAR